jgi:hypothetical protein
MRTGGDCYRAAARFILSLGADTDACLVHGEVSGQGKLAGRRYGHAWVEINGVVIDPSNGRAICMGRVQFYELGKIAGRQVRRYCWKEVIRELGSSAHYGPWGQSSP